MNFNFSHFTAALIFSICASVVFGITQRDEPRRMIRYGFYCFAWFIGGVLVAGWVMWFLKR
jgi:energy-converting hydrogenase Eha subunit A